MPRIVGDGIGVITGLVIAEEVNILCAFFEVPISHRGVGVDLFDFVVHSAKRHFLVSIDGLPRSCQGRPQLASLLTMMKGFEVLDGVKADLSI